ncbi:glycosyltransferase family 4 protein [Ligilactobacillus sp. WILCCON 0076]|uniref:Glycosyltransferase family 4 protein n=1 Tax=Ligilactobacillus ubinensis TaxID=2876789 RepID=A0A9X2JMC0_9LACO|nr:glycosyltransferase family 4 protein [Ligilactobacillus ubinensis]MCP0887922.1 glycosyltransferase family 4 protein [Ligilactobacillus ubinensis]
MNIGLFTDTYYPQVSGVATSIKTLREQLERQGHNVYIFTTTDPNVNKSVYERNIFRFTSIPFVSFTDRRIAVRGLFQAYQVAKKLELDIVHTQTEFSMGLIGKFVAKSLKIPCVHTYHTMYEDYLHYVAKGKLLKPTHVKVMTRTYCENMSGIIAPSTRVLDKLTAYEVKEPIKIISTGVDVTKFQQKEIKNYRKKYNLDENTPLILTLSRLAFEKDIDRLINSLPAIKDKIPNVKMMICGDGPARESLEQQVREMGLVSDVIFTGEIKNDEVPHYYHMADVFVSASVSESQGLTYIEALAAGLKIVTTHSPYTDELLDNPSLGITFDTPKEYVDSVVMYLIDGDSYQDVELRKKKLSESSAAIFGERIVAFYHSSQEYYLRKNGETSHSSEIG